MIGRFLEFMEKFFSSVSIWSFYVFMVRWEVEIENECEMRMDVGFGICGVFEIIFVVFDWDKIVEKEKY